MVAAFFLPLKQGFVYRPQGAKLGDAKRAVFWYLPAGAEKYRVLYADLHWSDLASDQLPEQPKK